jgi:hypothetical protein
VAEHFHDQQLGPALSSIRAAQDCFVVHQGLHVPFMSRDRELPPFKTRELEPVIPWSPASRVDLGPVIELRLRALLCVAHYVNPGFISTCRALTDGGELGVCRVVDVKTFGRMKAKRAYHGEHPPVEREHHLAAGSLNVDPIRVGVQSTTAEQQQQVWRRVQATFPKVCRVKNLFAQDAEVGAAGLRFILINVLYDSGVTYRTMLGSPEFAAAVEEAKQANLTVDEDGKPRSVADSFFAVSFDAAAEWLRAMLPTIGDTPVQMIAEVQLHLDYYVDIRKQTHLWFKVERSPDLPTLRVDCAKHVEALCAAGGGG